VIVTKVGARRDDTGAWLPASTPAELRAAVHDNLRRLGVDTLDVVNLRLMSSSGSVRARARSMSRSPPLPSCGSRG
jgi:aryl-alcohol dehydrogenase-like predicted oxidoreductase